MRNFFQKIYDWFSDDFTEWLSVYATVHFWVFLIVSISGNIYQYSFYKGYDKNVGIVVDAYSEEQLENFDLNRAIHEKNLLIFDLRWKLEECKSILEIIEEESDGSIAVLHTLEND